MINLFTEILSVKDTGSFAGLRNSLKITRYNTTTVFAWIVLKNSSFFFRTTCTVLAYNKTMMEENGTRPPAARRRTGTRRQSPAARPGSCGFRGCPHSWACFLSIITRILREVDGEAEGREAVFACHRDFFLVLGQNRLDDVKPQPVAVLVGAAGFVRLVEPLEQERDLLRRDGAAVVADGHDRRLRPGGKTQIEL